MRRSRTLSKDIPTYCPYYDYTLKSACECTYPWWKSCKGNRFHCIKLRQQWLASLPDKKRKTEQEKYG